MAASRGPGTIGTKQNPGRTPEGIRSRNLAFPGPIGGDVWNEAARAAGALPGASGKRVAPSARQRAEELVRKFAGRTGTGAFKYILRSAVAKGLLQRVQVPSMIDQSASSLCGPAALLYDLATRDPERYASYVISLYETGFGVIGRLEVKPGTDLKEHDPGNTVEASDWIALASLRDSENYFFDYQEAADEFAGITLPGELEDWFRKTGYTDVVNDARVIVDQEEANIQRADYYFRKGYRVCLFIHSNMLYKSKQSNGSATPDHWVVLTSPVSVGMTVIEAEPKRTISFTIYTWGKGRKPVPETGVLTVDEFLDNYYGFVAARY